MICIECDSEVSDKARFCGNCGAKFSLVPDFIQKRKLHGLRLECALHAVMWDAVIHLWVGMQQNIMRKLDIP